MSEQEIKKENLSKDVKNDGAKEISKDANKDVKNSADKTAGNATGSVAASKESTQPKREFTKNHRKPFRRNKERVKSEFDQKILDIRRVTRVASGGRRFTFSVSIVIGNKNGKVGVGIGKAGDTSLAIDKAVKCAKKNMFDVKKTDHDSIAHEIKAKYNSAQIIAMPAKGRGLIAGSAVRDVFELAGLTDINAKIISGSKNKLNIARATVKALQTLKK